MLTSLGRIEWNNRNDIPVQIGKDRENPPELGTSVSAADGATLSRSEQESEALKLLMRWAEATTSPKTGRYCRRRKGQRRSLDGRELLGAEGTQKQRIEGLDSSEHR